MTQEISRGHRAHWQYVPLEQLLGSLAAYGNPRIARLDSGWFCKVDMSVLPAGASFEVSSEFGHDSPMAAAIECEDRVHDAIDAMRKAASFGNADRDHTGTEQTQEPAEQCGARAKQ